MSRLRPRVVFLDHCAQLSGAELVTARLLEALGEDISPLVLLGEDGPLVSRLSEAGVPVDVVGLPTRVGDVDRASGAGRRAALASAGLVPHVALLARRLRLERAEVVHTVSLKSALYGGAAGRLARVPVLWHLHDRVAEDYLSRSAVRAVRTASRLLPSAIVANSAASLATLPAHPRGVVVPNAVAGGAPEQPRAGGPRASLTIGILGRLSPWKGQHVVIDAFARAFGDRPDVRLHVIGAALFGEDDYETRLRSQAAGLGIAHRVDFRGHRDDIWDELAQLDVLVHASTSPEPFGQVVLEGMAAGLAVVAADEGGPREVITHGVDGLLVPPRDPRLLALALVRLCADDEALATMGAAARRTASRYTPGRAAAGVLAAYRDLLA